ncbi:hypothetical protein RND81_09G227400 [Saponaria officinalis]|uniref:BSD domain-containing protein n=1 Tax=Saponaria officinalis TaxID=3572 RepID=A0AAW1IPA9_SAPOF
MDFFKSVFSDETPESPPSSDPQSSSPSQTLISDTSPKSSSSSDDDNATADTAGYGGGGGWSFGGLIQTLASKSETIIETYRRDLQEFNDGLKSETQVLKNVAASKAQVSLESVGKAVDSLGAAVSEIMSIAGDDRIKAEQSPENQSSVSRDVGVKYSRFEAQLRMIQMDERTYVEDNVEDGEKEEFEKWKLGFDLGEYAAEVEMLLRRRENGVAAIYERVVPSLVDGETFWLRYFYRVWRLKKAEFVRAKLVKRAIDGEDEEEELSWDVEDDNDNDNNDNVDLRKEDVKLNEVSNVSLKEENDNDNNNDVVPTRKEAVNLNEVTNVPVKEGNTSVESTEKEVDNVEVVVKKDEAKEGNSGVEESKDSDITVMSNQKLWTEDEEEEELGWDEIDDVGSGEDEKKGSSRVEPGKRLSVASVAAEDDEDLSWGIEDDDEPIKTST